jgi:gliding motility-associated-like protein
MKKIILSLSILLASGLIAPIASQAQITVVPSATAATLMNKLLGPGVIAINPVLTCAPLGNGTFVGFSTLSFDSGIVLSSGRAQTIPGNPGSNGPASAFASTGFATPGDPQLTALSGNPTHDACILEFDFRPAGDTVKFDYVFGSEEYTNYTCTGFNDPFGFFISGPGIVGAPSIAKVPGTGTPGIPVCINSVNCGPTGGGSLALCTAMGPGSPFCTYYVNNSTGATITYDGITKTLTAIAAVTPCDTYHLKIGVADASDDAFDSGVFLKAGSLTSTGISIAPVGYNPGDTVAGGQYCVRGCLPGKFVFDRTGNTTLPFTIHYVIAGTAVNGVDYTTIADSVVIPAGDTTTNLIITGLPVFPPVGPKIVKLLILAPYTCGGVAVVIDSAQLLILDSFYVHINTSDTAICLGQHVFISNSGDTVLSYTWSPAATLDNNTLKSPTATPTVTTTYVVSGQFVSAGCNPSHSSVTITVYTPPILDMGAPQQITCQGTPLQLNVIANPSGIPYSYSWTPTSYLSSATISNPVFTPGDSIDRVQSVTVSTPVVGCETTSSIFLHVLPNDFQLNSLDTGICYPPQSYHIRIVGDTEFSYHWTPSIGVSDVNVMDPTISPAGTSTYTVTASYPNCPDIVHSVLYSIEHPQVKILTGDTTICIGLPMPLRVLVTPEDSPYTFTWTPTTGLSAGDVIEPDFYMAAPGTYNYTIQVFSGLGCTDQDNIQIITAPPVKIGINPGNTLIPYGSEIQLTAYPISPDPLLYTWVPNNGTLNNPNINNPIAKPLDSVTTYIVRGMNQWGCFDSANVTIYVDQSSNNPTPTGFTPNGDGLNDIFRLSFPKYQHLVDFKIYNRWGQLVYENTNDVNKGWDGTFHGVPQDMGVYNYVLILGTPDGSDKVIKGDVTLIR